MLTAICNPTNAVLALTVTPSDGATVEGDTIETHDDIDERACAREACAILFLIGDEVAIGDHGSERASYQARRNLAEWADATVGECDLDLALTHA